MAPTGLLNVYEAPGSGAALNFLVPREAARDVASAFNSLVFRGEDRVRARRFILPCVVAVFAEDIGLLPQDLFTRLLDDCRRGVSACDLPGGLFRQVNDPKPARAGRDAGVDGFNGGLFAQVDPIELTPAELQALRKELRQFRMQGG